MDQSTYTEVTSIDELVDIVGTPIERVRTKVRPVLEDVHRQWLAQSPFALVATSDAEGNLDVSPKGDPAGFTLVLDEKTIVVPDRPGNRRVDGFRNVLVNPHVGLLYLVPGRGDTLRVNGRARLLRDAPFFGDLVVKGHRPTLAMLVEIDEVFHHCSKAFLRSRLWDPHTWDPQTLPAQARGAAVEPVEESVEELERRYNGPGYVARLYD